MILAKRASVLVVALALTACSSSSGGPTPSADGAPSLDLTRGVGDLDAFCALVVEGQGYTSDVEVAELTEEMYIAISDATTDDDPTAIAAIRAWGAQLGESVDEFIPAYEELLSVTDDPTLKRAIELTLELNGTLGLEIVDALVAITSLSQFNSVMNTIAIETNAALEDPADQDALLVFNDFILKNCGVSTTFND